MSLCATKLSTTACLFSSSSACASWFLTWAETLASSCCTLDLESEVVLTPHKLIFCINSFSPSNIILILSLSGDKKREKKHIQSQTRQVQPLLSCATTHPGAVCIYVAELWDSVLGVDGDDDLRAGLVPVKPTGHHFVSLQTNKGCVWTSHMQLQYTPRDCLQHFR